MTKKSTLSTTKNASHVIFMAVLNGGNGCFIVMSSVRFSCGHFLDIGVKVVLLLKPVYKMK